MANIIIRNVRQVLTAEGGLEPVYRNEVYGPHLKIDRGDAGLMRIIPTEAELKAMREWIDGAIAYHMTRR